MGFWQVFDPSLDFTEVESHAITESNDRQSSRPASARCVRQQPFADVVVGENDGAFVGKDGVAAGMVAVNVCIDHEVDWTTRRLGNVRQQVFGKRRQAIVNHCDMIFANKHGHITAAEAAPGLDHEDAGFDLGRTECDFGVLGKCQRRHQERQKGELFHHCLRKSRDGDCISEIATGGPETKTALFPEHRPTASAG